MLDLVLSLLATASLQGPIDRQALVSRHNVTLTEFNGERPIQVGNGEFAFGMDITGLQTFVPFSTMSNWGWHSSPLPDGTSLNDFQGQVWDTHGRPVRYPMPDPLHPEISQWLAGNPHRINLGRVGLLLRKADGTLAGPNDIQQTRQTLDLWHGTVTSRFTLEGIPVAVETACDPKRDLIASAVRSPLVKLGRLSAFFACPGDTNLQFQNFVGEWNYPAQLKESVHPESHRADLKRELGQDSYSISVGWKDAAHFGQPDGSGAPTLHILKAEYGADKRWQDVTSFAKAETHSGRMTLYAGNQFGPDPALGTVKALRVTYEAAGQTHTEQCREGESLVIDTMPERMFHVLTPDKASDHFSFVCSFSKAPAATLPSAESTVEASRSQWPKFWKSGGAIDLSESTDPRWKELERRIVLSQYLMKVNEAGSLPPQESGLVNNGWFGRWHMEMLWWHAAHYALWNRWDELNPMLEIYKKLLPKALARAKSEGYKGAHWPKCIGPDFQEWPHVIHSLLMWQQPHPIFFAELDYQAHPTQATLKKWQPVVEATADFLSTYSFFDKATNRYILGPPIMLVSENTDPKTTQNPTFELGYFRFGLRTALEWRHRLGLAPRKDWDRVLNKLAPLPTEEGRYVLHEGVKDMWTKWAFEHPALIGAYGMLPGDGVDRPTMLRTLEKVNQTWNFNHTWGWDFPMLAMDAARLGKPEMAIDFLLHPSVGFQFDERGLATGGPIPYFPANGGLLYAVAMMAAGWGNSPQAHAPGFPTNGKWKVKAEGLSRAL